jgi:hypothetical protein
MQVDIGSSRDPDAERQLHALEFRRSFLLLFTFLFFLFLLFC